MNISKFKENKKILEKQSKELKIQINEDLVNSGHVEIDTLFRALEQIFNLGYDTKLRDYP